MLGAALDPLEKRVTRVFPAKQNSRPVSQCIYLCPQLLAIGVINCIPPDTQGFMAICQGELDLRSGVAFEFVHAASYEMMP
jgi:hypothetical protein